MNKAKEILYKHAKSKGCKSDLLNNPFLEQAVLNAINEALTIPDVSRSLQLYDVDELNEIVKMYNNKEIEMFDFIATVWNKAYAVGRNDG